jgi:hypothetical protein
MLRFCLAILVVASVRVAVADTAPQPWTVGVTDDQKTRAKTLLDEGNLLLLDKKYVDALAKYTAAVGVWDHPAIRFNMVRCLIQLDRRVEATENLEKALKYGSAPLEDTVYQEALTYQKLLANQIGAIEVECKQDGVTLTLDGKPFAACPATTTRRLEPGHHQLVGTKRGLLPRTVEVVVFGGKTERVAIDLDPLAKGAKVVHRWPGYVPWVAFGVGAALVGAGTLLQVNAGTQMDSYDLRIDEICTRRCAPGTIPDDVEDIRRGAELKSAIGVSMLVAGAATVATGAVLMYLNRGRTVYPESITPLPGGGAALTWGGRF